MSHDTFEHIKGTEDIFVGHIFHLKCMELFDSLDLKGKGKSLDMTFFEDLFHISAELPTQTNK